MHGFVVRKLHRPLWPSEMGTDSQRVTSTMRRGFGPGTAGFPPGWTPLGWTRGQWRVHLLFPPPVFRILVLQQLASIFEAVHEQKRSVCNQSGVGWEKQLFLDRFTRVIIKANAKCK